jgi:lipoyl-dependent peroxiredoxin
MSSFRSRTRPPRISSAPLGRPVTWAITLPAAVDAEIDLNLDGSSFFLRARLNVSVPGVDRKVAQELVDAAHQICPYSKAPRGNIEVKTTLV